MKICFIYLIITYNKQNYTYNFSNLLYWFYVSNIIKANKINKY